MPRRFETVDVFTDWAFGGNQLAVVLDAEGLSPALMQRIAAEFGYAETSFVIPPADPRHTARVRIFTPESELPFAGHPNVGTGFVLARSGQIFGKPAGETLLFEEAAGLVPVEVIRRDGRVTGARLTAPQRPATGKTLPAAAVGAALGLDAGEVATTIHPPTVASAGLPFLMAEATSRVALDRARPDADAISALLENSGAAGIELYARDDGTGHAGAPDLHARVFAPSQGVIEDAATGSANVALAGFLAGLDPRRDGTITTRIAQGAGLGRPSLLIAEVDKKDGQVTQARIGGDCVPVMRGELLVGD